MDDFSSIFRVPLDGEMESRLTQSEMDAVMQLIQLSREFHVFCVNFHDEIERGGNNREESVGETTASSSSSILIDRDEKAMLSEEALPRRRKKWRTVVDIYANTQPLIKGGRKRPRI